MTCGLTTNNTASKPNCRYFQTKEFGFDRMLKCQLWRLCPYRLLRCNYMKGNTMAITTESLLSHDQIARLLATAKASGLDQGPFSIPVIYMTHAIGMPRYVVKSWINRNTTAAYCRARISPRSWGPSVVATRYVEGLANMSKYTSKNSPHAMDTNKSRNAGAFNGEHWYVLFGICDSSFLSFPQVMPST